jgi:hypothetical protein
LHASLKLRPNLIMIAACVLVAAGTSMLPGQFPGVAWAFAAVFGVAVGDLQSRGIRSTPQAFRDAKTSIEVRSALMSTRPGRMAVVAQWILVPVLLGTAWWSGNLTAGAIGGYAVFMAVRDAVALSAVVWLASPAGTTDS